MQKITRINFLIGILIMGLISSLSFISCSTACETAADFNTEKINGVNNYKNGEFFNSMQTNVMQGSFLLTAWDFIFSGSDYKFPVETPPTELININAFVSNNDELSAIWLGHATILLKMGDHIFLTDPVFSKRVSPYSFIGPKRFFEPPIKIEELPKLDAIIISHDHYDHLDKKSIKKLDEKTEKFIVPLGIAAHLKKWGINPLKIIEKNWWEEIQLNKSVKIVCTPARHFSGRGILDRNKTLWSSWAIKAGSNSVYFGGDTGIFPGFSEIGNKYGPFDITILPIGAYGKNWPLIHMNPEEAVVAHKELKGNLMIPIHWGTFDLALHSWTEPAERLISFGNKNDINFVIPKAGEIIKKTDIFNERWWPDLPNENKTSKNKLTHSAIQENK